VEQTARRCESPSPGSRLVSGSRWASSIPATNAPVSPRASSRPTRWWSGRLG
jgi:hypothetical protein